MGRQRSVGRRRVILATLLITAAAGLAGAAAATTTRTVPSALIGCWSRHVGALPVGTGPGVWLVKITKAGKLAAYTPGSTKCDGDFDFTATVSVAGSHLTIGPVPVCGTKGLYTWKASGKRLTLRAVAEKSCAARRLLFTGVWKKK
jgi:hypothetical protein